MINKVFSNRVKESFLRSRKPNELISILEELNIDYVIDVRKNTWMPLYYRPQAFKELLKERNISYFHCGDLGNPTKLRMKALEGSKREASLIRDEDLHPLSTMVFRFTQQETEEFSRENPSKKAIWRKQPTHNFKNWKEEILIDKILMDNLAKEYYLNYIREYKPQFVQNLFDFIINNENLIFCILCSCNTINPNKCHRFWLIEELFRII